METTLQSVRMREQHSQSPIDQIDRSDSSQCSDGPLELSADRMRREPAKGQENTEVAPATVHHRTGQSSRQSLDSTLRGSVDMPASTVMTPLEDLIGADQISKLQMRTHTFALTLKLITDGLLLQLNQPMGY